MQRPILARLVRGGDDWRHGAWLIVLGLTAYMVAQFFPNWLHFFWYDAMPLFWAAGALVLAGTWYLPNRPLAWIPLKLVIVGAVIHWALVLPLAYWIEYWQFVASRS